MGEIHGKYSGTCVHKMGEQDRNIRYLFTGSTIALLQFML